MSAISFKEDGYILRVLVEDFEDKAKELDKWISDAKDDVPLKVKRLTNQTGRIFLMQRKWNDTNPAHLIIKGRLHSIVEIAITEHWNFIKDKVTRKLRDEMLSYWISKYGDEFVEYSNKILPFPN